MSTQTQPEVVFATHGPGFHFCGYYDVSPFDAQNQRLLTHRVQEFNRMPRGDDIIEVGYWQVAEDRYEVLGKTRAYNWQQGSKLQWLGPDFGRKVIFNDRGDDHFIARIIDVDAGSEHVVDHPIYTVHPNGHSAICVNYERTYFPRPGYSYQGIEKPEWNCPVHPDDGLFRLDLEDGSLKRIVAIGDVLEHRPLSSMKGATHYLEHAMFNPDGSQFVFLHRWQTLDGGIYTRAYVADEWGKGLRLLIDSGRFSHAGWRNPNELTAFAGVPTALSSMRKHQALIRFVLRPLLPIYRRLFSSHSPIRKKLGAADYLQFDVRGGTWRRLAPEVAWPDDGHMSWSPTSNRWMLTDTYEDESFDRHLYLFDARDQRLIEVGRFHSTPSTCSTGWRCDLHPRFDRTGKRVVIDSLHVGDERQVYVIDVSDIVEGRR